ncbi:MAG: peptidylprolyl isomerase [Hyphomonadaceae bacterium]|nr:peptidylprolyl isomerase [Hyphomonadaceae bacterium]
MRGFKVWALVAVVAAAMTAPGWAQPRPPAGAAAQATQQQATQAAAAAPAQLSEGVAAVVNDDVISTYDVRQRSLLLLASSGIEPSGDNQQRARSQAMRDLVDERLQLQEARQFDIRITPDAIDRSIAEIARQNNMTPTQFTGQLTSAGINPSTLRAQIEADTAWRRLINGRYASRVRISDLQIRDTLARIASNATRTQYQASEIFLPADTDAEFAEAEQVAMRLLQEMQRGAPFPLVARQFSAAPSSAAGGDLGWFAEGEVRPEVQAALDRLQQGQVSTPFRVAEGVYIVALRDKRTGAAAESINRVSLRQITAPAASRSALDRARRRISSCDNLQNATSGVTGVEIADLGSVAEGDLSDVIRAQISGVSPGQTTAIAITDNQASLMVVCNRETAAAGMPTRDEIENRLFEQELAMLSQRYLRNLRREATIITRNQ